MRFAVLVFKIVGNYVHVMKINPFSKINYSFGIFPEVCHFHAHSSEKILNALQQFTSQPSFQEGR